MSTVITEHFSNFNPDNLNFSQLCEYTASFFDPITQCPDDQIPQELWDAVCDKIAYWNRIRIVTMFRLRNFTDSQKRAYYYCVAMFDHLFRNHCYDRDQYKDVYAFYREWRNDFRRLISN